MTEVIERDATLAPVKRDTPTPAKPPKLLDQVRERIRVLHYARATENTYLHWIKFYIHFHGLRHPRDMGAAEVEAFLSHLATVRDVAAGTQNQAMHAILFLYRQVLGVELGWLDSITRAKPSKRLPVVLTQGEAQRLLAATRGTAGLVVRLLDGTWHRPFTTLELAALQSLVEPEEYLELDGLSDSDWRERIGNAVPPDAAAAIAGVMGTTLLLAWSGETFMLSASPIWVRPVAVALAVAQGRQHG